MQKPRFDDLADEKPLDPAAEKVRRKLVRFVAINLGILFAAVMAVLAAVVYKSGVVGPASESAIGAAFPSPSETVFVEAAIALPAGSRIVSQSLSGDRLALHAELADGTSAIFLYDVAQRRMLGRYALTPE